MTFFNFLITMFWKKPRIRFRSESRSGSELLFWIRLCKNNLDRISKTAFKLYIHIIYVSVPYYYCYFCSYFGLRLLFPSQPMLGYIIYNKVYFFFYRWYKSDRKNSNYWTTTGKQTISRIFVVRTLKYENKPPLNLNKHF